MANNGKAKDLSPRQRRAIAALLTEIDTRAAARAAGVGYRTLHRWLAENSAFRKELAQAEGEVIKAAGRRLLAGLPSTQEVLFSIAVRGAEESQRRQAAQAWLENALRWHEAASLEQRIDELESLLYEFQNE